MIKLIGLHFSPFTHRARWALELCGLPYTYAEYLPLLGEPVLRLRMRKWSGPVSAPVLFSDGQVVDGSSAIVRFAARSAGDHPLGDLEAARAWEQLADRAICEGRTRVIQRSLQRPEVQSENLAGVVPAPLRSSMRWMARAVLRRLHRKYGQLAVEGAMHDALSRARIQLGSQRYLLGSFSYADIAIATCMEMVAPRAQRGVHTSEAWTWPELAREFADLIAWRDELIDARGPLVLRRGVRDSRTEPRDAFVSA